MHLPYLVILLFHLSFIIIFSYASLIIACYQHDRPNKKGLGKSIKVFVFRKHFSNPQKFTSCPSRSIAFPEINATYNDGPKSNRGRCHG